MAEHPPILIVDDEEVVRVALTDILDMFGYPAVTAKDGLEAVRMFTAMAGGPGVYIVILDLMMPGLNGIDTMHKLCAINPDAVIIIASGYDQDEVVARFTLGDLNRDKVHFLQKPYTMATIVNLVEQYQGAQPS